MIFGYELFIIFLMLVFNAIFAAYEMALASISKTRIMILVGEKRKGAVDTAFMKDRIGASLAVIQLGITFVGAFAAATGGAGVEEKFTPWLHQALGISDNLAGFLSLILLIIPLSMTTIIFGELVPKMFAISNKEWVVLRLSPVMKFLYRLAYPVIRVIENLVQSIVGFGSKKLTRKESFDKRQGLSELMTAVSLARSSELLGAREEKIVVSAAHLALRPVREIMIPAQDIFTLNIDSSLLDAFLKIHLDMHTRFPICAKGNDPQTIAGYVNFKDITVALKMSPSDPSIKSIMRPITFVDESMLLSHLLEKLMQEKTHIAIVKSKSGKVLGMITIEDVLEELVGEIEDEFDKPLTHIHAYGAGYLMGGGVIMTKVGETLGVDFSKKYEGGRVPTLEEWCREKFGPDIKGAISIEDEGIKVVPRKFRRKRLAEASVTRVSHDG